MCVGVMCTVLVITECVGGRAHKQLFAELSCHIFDCNSPCIKSKESNIIIIQFKYSFSYLFVVLFQLWTELTHKYCRIFSRNQWAGS